jgi:hypothetical protein
VDWIVYVLGPIDHDWEKLKTVRATVADIANYEDEFSEAHDLNSDAVRSFLESWESAKSAASRHGWEGDFRHDPYVFWLPSETGFDHGFVFKQDNNGTTFVLSTQELPALARLAG